MNGVNTSACFLTLSTLLILSNQTSSAQTDNHADGSWRTGLRARWQQMSPEQKQAALEKFRQRRMNFSTNPYPSSAKATAPQESSSYTLRSNVAYGSDPLQKLDIYLPQKATGPILFFVHGGGWSRGDKAAEGHAAKGRAYTADGIIFVSVNYRLAPAVVHPQQIEDIARAFSWVQSHAAELGGDKERIFIMGHSAGAHLVDLLGTSPYIKEQGLDLSSIKGVVSLDTASLNLTTPGDDTGESQLVGGMIDKAFGTDPRVLQDASPTLNIHPGEKYPPFIMYCGTSRVRAIAQHKEFAARMAEAGGKTTVYPVQLSHGEINREAGQPDKEIYKTILQLVQGGKPNFSK